MKKINLFLSAILIVTLSLTGCASQTSTPTAVLQPKETPTTGPVNKTILIGFTTSLTGSLNAEARRQTNGILLWMNQVNKRGGLALTDGSIVTFEPKFYDDQSDRDTAISLYERLVLEDNVDFFFSPYSSTLTDAIAPAADKYEKIMIAAGAASDSTFKKGYQNIYQVYTPASNYLLGALDLLSKEDPTAKRIAIVYENDRFSTSVVESLKKYAEGQAFEIVAFESYNSGTSDFIETIRKLSELNPDALLGGGHAQDGQALAKQVYENSLNVKYMALLIAPTDAAFANLGEAAFGVVGASQWEPRAKFQTTFGPSVTEFNQAYQAAYSDEPTYHAAGGYAAGLILEKALIDAGSLDQQKIRAALDNIKMVTFFGPISFDRSGAAHGLQIGRQMLYIQWQKNADGVLTKEIIWPDNAKTDNLFYPIP